MMPGDELDAWERYIAKTTIRYEIAFIEQVLATCTVPPNARDAALRQLADAKEREKRLDTAS